MVRSTSFSLSLLNVDTGSAFKEHLDDKGNSWVAGEAGIEYWIEVQSDKEAGLTLAEVEVDGVKIGYRVKADSCKRKIGAWNASDNSSFKALAFSDARSDNVEGGEDSANKPSFGMIKVTWYRAIVTTSSQSNSVKIKQWVGGSRPPSHSKGKEKAGSLKTTVGTTTASGARLCKEHYKNGDVLCTLCLYYTSEFGLAVRKILKEPTEKKVKTEVIGPLRAARKRAREEKEAGTEANPINVS